MPKNSTDRQAGYRAGECARIAAATPGSVLLQTARADAENSGSYLFVTPERTLIARHPDEIPVVFEAVEKSLGDGLYVAGFLSYEAGYHFEPASVRGGEPVANSDVPLVWFGVFRKPLVCPAHETQSLESEERDSADVQPEPLRTRISPKEYGEAIEKIRRYIEAGDLYQANFTIPMRGVWREDASRLFERMMRNQPVPYGALINLGDTQILSASPELFFRRQGNEIAVRPMKGTARRGRDLREDARQTAWLAADEKNRAENVMIVDLLRNDLSRICTSGSIRVTDLFTVERYPDLLQMTSTIRGQLRPHATYYDIFRSLFPCGSITGAPKIRTMQVIRKLEREQRGIACGAIGFFAPQGQAVFSVAIRTATLRDGELQMRVGSGVTYDSDAESEYAECALKATFLNRAPAYFELIETLLWNRDFFLLDLHLARLADSAAYFGFQFNMSDLREQLLCFAASLQTGSQHRVRMLLSRNGTVSIASEPITEGPHSVALMLAPEPTDSGDLFLRHKTTRRDLYNRGLAVARANGFDDALFLNERGKVTECAIHNIMIASNGKLVTPPIECGVLPGIYRRYLLDAHPEIEERAICFDELKAAKRVFVFNSVRGLRRVRAIESNPAQ